MSHDGEEAVRLDVSRETFARLETFAAVLRKWNPRINLVSRNSLNVLWQRHIADSLQVFRCVEAKGHWVDLGSGGGFPGIVVAILAAEELPELKVTLIESDQRKATFLRGAAREAGVDCEVIAARIEGARPQRAQILSARAVADLGTLLGFAELHLAPGGVALFPKGVTWEKEVADARRQWKFDVDPITSRTEDGAVILKIEGASRA